MACTEEQANVGRKTGEARTRTEKKFENRLDIKWRVRQTPRRASYCLPPRSTFRRSSPIRTPDKVSEEYRCLYN